MKEQKEKSKDKEKEKKIIRLFVDVTIICIKEFIIVLQIAGLQISHIRLESPFQV